MIKDIYRNKELNQIQQRWDYKAENWDSDLKNPNHHLNLDGAYEKFLEVSENIIKNRNNYSENTVLLDLACGTGIVSSRVSNYFNSVIGIDISQEMINKANEKNIKNAKFIKMDCFDLCNIGMKMDVIISRGIIISHYGTKLSKQLLGTLKKCLKQNGIIILDFLNKESKDKFSYLVDDKEYYNSKEIESIIKEIGFSKIKIYGEKENRILIACIYL